MYIHNINKRKTYDCTIYKSSLDCNQPVEFLSTSQIMDYLSYPLDLSCFVESTLSSLSFTNFFNLTYVLVLEEEKLFKFFGHFAHSLLLISSINVQSGYI